MVYKLPEVVPSKNLVIEDPWGKHSIKIEKDLLLESFINEIIDKTVPYIECHRKCGAQRICPYASDEVKCQIQQNAIKNFFKYAGTEVNLSDAKTLVKFTKVAIFYAKYAFHSFNLTCSANEEWLYEKMTKLFLKFPFYMACPVIDSGNKFLSLIRELIPNEFVQSVLLVEGDCEEIVFRKLFMKPDMLHPRFDQIRNMRGEGNFKRVELLIDELRREHYKIHILADGDGQMINIIKQLKKRSELSNDEYTLFQKAFEDAFPNDVVIKHFHEILPDKYHDLVTKAADTAWQSKRKSFSSVLKRMLVELGIEPKEVAAMLSSAKKEVAKLFAEDLDHIIFDAGFKNFDSQGVEILQVTQRLIFCS